MKTLTLFIMVLVSASLLMGEIIHVPTQKSTIQGGINLASEGDTVLVTEETYYENINFKGKAITVASEFIMDGDTSHISKTIIDGSQYTNPDSASVVYFISGEDTTSVLCGFTITGGKGTYNDYYDLIGGGGILMLSGGKILHNRIRNININSDINTVGAGIAINPYFTDINVVIENNAIKNNSIFSSIRARGAGILVASLLVGGGGFCRINKNIVSKNTLTHTHTEHVMGAGILIEQYLPTNMEVIVSNNVITYNEARGWRSAMAGIAVLYFEPGGEYYDYNPSPYIYNNIIAHNSCEGSGAGIGVYTEYEAHSFKSIVRPQPAIINNTIVNNSGKDGCGILNLNSYPLLMNNIIWNDLSYPGSNEIHNGIDPFSGAPYWYDFNFGKIYLYSSLIQDENWENINNGCFNLDPLLFVDDFILTENSPAIGLGRRSINIDEVIYEAPAVDFDGNPRPNQIDTLIDIGSFESPYLPSLKLYPNSFESDKLYANPEIDTVRLTAKIVNPDLHDVNLYGRITSIDSSVIDSVELFDDGNHGDGQSGDGLYGGELEPLRAESEFCLSLGIKDNFKGIYDIFNSRERFTSIGPVTYQGYTTLFKVGNSIGIKLYLKNEGQIATANGITADLKAYNSEDITEIRPYNYYTRDIPAGQTVEAAQTFNILTTGDVDTFYFYVNIYSNGCLFWNDSSGVATSLTGKNLTIPKKFFLSQNYPNPFNPKTIINYELPITNYVELTIFNSLGQKVATLISERQQPGRYNVEWDASMVASGVYYYRLKTEQFMDTKKLVVMK